MNPFNRFLSFLLCVCLSVLFITACNNQAKDADNSGDTATEEVVVPFEKKVADYDSSWQERISKLDESIEQWEEGAKRYKGSLSDRMEKHLKKAKAQRDSLKDQLSTLGDQTEENWKSFKSGVSDQYSRAVESIKEVGEEINK